ncbi:MAG: ABC transporter permease [Bryobacterales bacterium]|nr:ABC transporter permease [Bryobacterales bacterium]
MTPTDLRQALRSIRNAKGFTATAALTLAVCLGANTAIFTIVNSVLLRPIPVPRGDEVVILSNRYPNAGVATSYNSGVVDYFERRTAITTLQEQALLQSGSGTVEIQGVPQRVEVNRVTPSFLGLVQVAPSVGRTFAEAEGEPGNERKVILSYGLFQQLYGADASAIGKQLRISGRDHEIVGVMPAGFRFINPEVQLWTPLAFSGEQKTEGRHSNNYFHLGRLRPGASVPQVQSQVDALNRSNLERFPEWREVLVNAGFHTAVEPLQEMLVGDIRRMLYVLWAGAIFVLLIGVLNLLNLSLARLNLRTKEIATRLALGAGHWQVLRALLAESMLLAVAGGALGVLVSWIVLQAIDWIGIEQLPRSMMVRLDWVSVAYGLAVASLVGVIMGLLPALRLFHSDLAMSLRSESRGGTSGPTARTARRFLVVAQVAFGFLLLAGAGLLTVSFRQLLAVDPGFRAEGVTTAGLQLPSARYGKPESLRSFQARLLDTLRAQPGVASAGTTTIIPFSGDTSDSVILPEGYVGKPGESLVSPFQVRVSDGYFETMGIRLMRGRHFDQRDSETSTAVAMIDESLAQRFWPNADPIGKRFFQPSNTKNLTQADKNTRFFTVVGVVRDVRILDMGTPSPVGTYYFPAVQMPSSQIVVAAKSGGGSAVGAIRRSVSSIDPELALFDIRTMDERTALSLSSRRAAMMLATSFGAVAMFLTAIGIYGVLAYLVSMRIREIGIRLALGATGNGIFWLVLKEGLTLAGTGVLFGMAGAVLVQRGLQSQIYGVSALDPTVMLLTSLSLALVAAAASSLPAGRAMRVDPVRVLSEQ